MDMVFMIGEMVLYIKETTWKMLGLGMESCIKMERKFMKDNGIMAKN